MSPLLISGATFVFGEEISVSLFMGGETTSSRAVVQSAGDAYQLPGYTQHVSRQLYREDAP
jgi:hypothetical protein